MAESSKKAAARRKQNREQQKTTRQRQSDIEREHRLLEDRNAKKARREEEDEEERGDRLLRHRQAMRQRRQEEDEEEREVRVSTVRQAMRERRQGEDEEQREVRVSRVREATRARRQQERNQSRQNKNDFCGRKAEGIMAGSQSVPLCNMKPLFENGQPTGRKCEHCSAMLWPNEPKGLCCSSGIVKLEPLFDTRNLGLGYMKDLCIGDSAEAAIYRKFARNINNAVSLASLKVQRVFPSDRGWVPAVVIQGKVAIQVGPIVRTQKQNSPPPMFSQLYVLDEQEADQELDFRFGTMLLSSNITENEKMKLQNLLVTIVRKLKEFNPYIKDYVSAAEIIRDEICDNDKIKIILDADKRPDGQHARRFNTDFHEITVLFDDEHPGPRDVVLVARGEPNEIKKVRDTSRCADPLRFTLMFPEGNDGWHLNMKAQIDEEKEKNITG